MSYFLTAWIENLDWSNYSRNKPTARVPLDLFEEVATSIVYEIDGQEETETLEIKVDWENKFRGQVKLTGVFNYCYVEDRYYFLNQIKRFDEVTYLYELVYDFWANDVLNPTFQIIGTQLKTSDPELVKKYLHTTEPIISGGNEVKRLNVPIERLEVEPTEEEKNWFVPGDQWEGYFLHFHPTHVEQFKQYLLQGKDETRWAGGLRAVLPKSYREKWQQRLLREVTRWAANNVLKVYDLNAKNFPTLPAKLKELYKTGTLSGYVIGVEEKDRINYAGEAVNLSKVIKEIDLRGITDVVPIETDTLEEKTYSGDYPSDWEEEKEVYEIPKDIKFVSVSKDLEIFIPLSGKTVSSFLISRNCLTDSGTHTNTGQVKAGEVRYFVNWVQPDKPTVKVKCNQYFPFKFYENGFFYTIEENLLIPKIKHDSEPYKRLLSTLARKKPFFYFEGGQINPRTVELTKKDFPWVGTTFNTVNTFAAIDDEEREVGILRLLKVPLLKHQYIKTGDENWKDWRQETYVLYTEQIHEQETNLTQIKGAPSSGFCDSSEWFEYWNLIDSCFNEWQHRTNDAVDLIRSWEASFHPDDGPYHVGRANNGDVNEFRRGRLIRGKRTPSTKHVHREGTTRAGIKEAWNRWAAKDGQKRKFFTSPDVREYAWGVQLVFCKLQEGYWYTFTIDIVKGRINFGWLTLLGDSRQMKHLFFNVSGNSSIYELIGVLAENNTQATHYNPFLSFKGTSPLSYQDYEREETIYTKGFEKLKQLEILDEWKQTETNRVTAAAFAANPNKYLPDPLPYWDYKNLSTGAHQLYDLKGTNFILCVSKPAGDSYTFELICKEWNLSLESLSLQVKTMRVAQKTQELAALINQTNSLYVFGTLLPLKTRFNLSADEISFRTFKLRGIEPKQQTPFNHWLLEFETEEEGINTTIKEIKEISDSLRLSTFEYEQLKLQHANEQRLRQSDRKTLDEARTYEETKYRHALKDQRDAEELQGWNEQLGYWGLGVGALGSLASGQFKLMNIANLVTAGLEMQKNNWTGRLQLSQNQRNIDRDYQYGSRKYEISSERMHGDHRNAEAMNRLQLVKASSNLTIGLGNDAGENRALNDTFGVGNVYLIIQEPKGKTLEKLKQHYEEFGYDIYAGNQLIEGPLTPGIYQFGQIDQISPEHPEIKAELKSLFQQGFKVLPRTTFKVKEWQPLEGADTLSRKYLLQELQEAREKINQLETNFNPDCLPQLENKTAELETANNKIKELEKQISQASEQINRHQLDIEDRDQKIKRLEIENQTTQHLEQTVQELEKERDEYKKQLDFHGQGSEYHAQIATELRDKVDKLTSQIKELNKQLTDVNADNTQKAQELNSKTQKIKELENEKEKALSDLAEEEKKVADLITKKEEATGKVVELGFKIGELENKQKEQTEKIKNLLDDIDDKAGTIAAFEQTTEATKTQLTEKIAELNKHIKELETAKGQIDEHSKEITDLKTKLRTADNRLRETADQAHNLQTQLNNSTARYHTLAESFRNKEKELADSEKLKDLYHNEKTKLGDELNEEKRNHNKTHEDNKNNIQSLITELQKDEPDLNSVQLLPDFKRLSGEITKAANKQTEKAIRAMEENWGTQVRDIRDTVSNAFLHNLNLFIEKWFAKEENKSDFAGFEAYWESRFYSFERGLTSRAIKNFRTLLTKLKTAQTPRIEVKSSEFLSHAGEGNWYAQNETLVLNTLKGIANAVDKTYSVKFENGKLVFTKLNRS